MEILLDLSALALRQTLRGATEWNFAKADVDGGERLVGILVRHFTDHSQTLTEALKRANDNAWRGLEMALTGDSWWNRAKGLLVPAEAKSFQLKVEAWLEECEKDHTTKVRERCVKQLRQAREKKLLTGSALDVTKLARQVSEFARFDQPHEVYESEWKTIATVGERLENAGFKHLAFFLTRRPPQGDSILVIGVRYFFRREVEKNQQLFQGLTFTKLEDLSKVQIECFAGLEDRLRELEKQVEKIGVGVETIQTGVGQVHTDLLDLKAELRKQSQQNADFCQSVLQALEQHRLNQSQMTARNGYSMDDERDRKAVKELVDNYKALPAERRREMPALLNALAKLKVGVGDFAGARQDFHAVAQMVPEARARADAFVNEYYAALEQEDWDGGLDALRKAIAVDPKRFAPFRLDRYEPVKILGAGGFGVAFLCTDRVLKRKVVVKVLRPDTLARSVDDIVREARVLDQLNHPAIVRLRDCDFVDPDEQKRPFFVMDFFEGQNLADYVAKNGPLSNQDLVAVASQIAEGLKAAHEQDILHRDVKPHNVLVRKDKTWQVKLIDFGLAMEQHLLAEAKSGSYQKSVMGRSIAGTRDYAAPEQLGKLNAPVGPPSDIYGFARTCWFARFGTVNTGRKAWESLPPLLAELLDECLEDEPGKRPANFDRVLKHLREPALFDDVKTVLRVPDKSPSGERKRRKEKPVQTVEEVPDVLALVELTEHAAPARPPLDVVPIESGVIKDALPAGRAVMARLVFEGAPKIGFLDTKVEVWLDQKFVGWGTLARGFRIDAKTTSGRRRVQLQMTFVTQTVEVDLPEAGSCEVRFVYETTWSGGNFSPRAEVRALS